MKSTASARLKTSAGRLPGSAGRSATSTARSLDRVFKALASEIRREALDALRKGPLTTGELVMQFPELSRFAVMQHLKVLVRAKLIVVRKRGRERHNFLNVVPIQMLHERWVGRYEALWAGTLTGLRDRAEAPAIHQETRRDREGLSH